MTSTLSQYHDSSNLMPKVLTYLDAAYEHICHAKKEAHPNHDTWSIRFDWDQEKQSLCQKLLAGSYYFSASKAYKVGNHSISVWHSLDSVVTTALSLFLQDWLYPKIGVIDQCYHLKGKGIKAAVKTVRQLTKKYTYTFKTDIKSYYASIDRHLVQAIFCRWIKDRRILSLLWQYCDRIEDVNGCLVSQTQGIPKGGPLSIVIGTIYLVDLDQISRTADTQYIRYMDDIILLSHSRHRLRQLIKQVYKVLDALGLKLAAAKTFIGRVNKGFDFLGYHIGSSFDSVAMSQVSQQRLKERVQRLYEQRVSQTCVAAYVQRWCRWAKGGLGQIKVILPKPLILFLTNNPDDASAQIMVSKA